jgi:hypothetical protein
MPVFNTAPVLIDPVNYQLWNEGQRGFAGPFEVGSSLYAIFGIHEGGGLQYIRAFKRATSGGSWAELDSANAPGTSGLGTAGTTAILNGTTITVIYSGGSGGALQPVTFDTTTDTWGTPGTIAGIGDFQLYPQSVQLSNGDVYVFFLQQFGSGPTAGSSISYRKYTGGSWGSITQFTPQVAGETQSGAGGSWFQFYVDSNDLIHGIYSILPGGSLPKTISLYHGTLDSSGTITLGNLIDTFSATSFVNVFLPSPPTIANGQVYVSICGAWRNVATVYIGDDPLATAPGWTVSLASDTQITDWFINGSYAFSATDGVLAYVFWTVFDSDNPSDIIQRIYYATHDGSTWSAPIEYYDFVINPPASIDTPVDPSNFSLFQLSVAILSGTGLGVLASMLYSNDLFENAGFDLISGGGAGAGNRNRFTVSVF